MAGLRNYLHWIAIALLAGFAQISSLVFDGAKKVRTRKRKTAGKFLASDGVVALTPCADVKRKARSPQPEGGAVILAFRQRAMPEPTADEPPALTGSR